MKIEIGESLMLSWLRHIKNCQVVQLNWKPSRRWTIVDRDREVLDDLMRKAAAHFSEELELDVFGKTTSCSQLMQQGEIDALGIAISLDGNQRVFAIDSAFHENGLNYGSTSKTEARVVKKLVRTALLVRAYFPKVQAEVIFASPKIHDATFKPLVEAVNATQRFLDANQFPVKCRLIANEDFEKTILAPVCEIADKVADTSELFLRSFQLLRLFPKSTNPWPRTVRSSTKNAGDEPRIGELVRERMHELLDSGELSSENLSNLLEEAFSKCTFGLNYAMLKKVLPGDVDEQRFVNRYARYWKEVFGGGFLVCKEWHERNRQPFLSWYHRVIGEASS